MQQDTPSAGDVQMKENLQPVASLLDYFYIAFALHLLEHIMSLLKENPGYKGIRLIPKLTDSHCEPSKIPRMKVKFATQLFSQTVASNLGYLADKGIIPEEAKSTADILLFFDQLFDSVNGSFVKRKKHGKPLLGPATPTSVHRKIWMDSINC